MREGRSGVGRAHGVSGSHVAEKESPMICRNTLARLVVATMLAAMGGTAGAAERLPNFVIIFIDDMGYADIGPFGAKGYATPNLDRLAQEGPRVHRLLRRRRPSARRRGRG